MKKEDLTVPAIFAEAIGMILGIVYIGLQIYYGIVYKVAPYKFICNIAGVVLIYVGLSLVSCQPEKINRLPKEVCVGKVRKYSIRMISKTVSLWRTRKKRRCRRRPSLIMTGMISRSPHRTMSQTKRCLRQPKRR